MEAGPRILTGLPVVSRAGTEHRSVYAIVIVPHAVAVAKIVLEMLLSRGLATRLVLVSLFT